MPTAASGIDLIVRRLPEIVADFERLHVPVIQAGNIWRCGAHVRIRQAIKRALPAGTRMEPHRHPEDRVYTVISGVFYIGLGDEFDETRLQAFPPGAVIVLPGGQPHFHWAKSGEYVTQVTAIGPLGLAYVDRDDDPRRRS